MAAFLLAACGDGNKAGDPDPSAEADLVVDSFDDLSVCIDDREGATAYVKVDVPAEWANAEDPAPAPAPEGRPATVKMVQEILNPVGKMDGDSLPVSAFVDHADGTFELGAAAYEKRGVAVSVPAWDETKCIQCNQCAYVCPHATIRPFALNADEAAAAPAQTKCAEFKVGAGKGVYKFAMSISPMDCMGCGVCVGICPAKALSMQPLESQKDQQEVFDYMVAKVAEKKELQDNTVKGSQFKQPMLEFSGSCAGCAETSYARLVTQLFGDHMMISNATGCSSIWGGPAATSPYTVNKEGKGPAWANSLFEDNAEHGLGMYLGQKKIRDDLKVKVEAMMAAPSCCAELKEAAQKWLDTYNDGAANQEATKALIAEMEEDMSSIDSCIAFLSSDMGKQIYGENQPAALAAAEEAKANGETVCTCGACQMAKQILAQKDYLNKKSCWIFGGDGWAFDIGFGGVDHVLASGEDVNVFVFNTEVYSNTGGQASKASNIGQVAQFAAAGKEIKAKSLSEIAMTYGYVYVAQVAMGSNPAQTIKAETQLMSATPQDIQVGCTSLAGNLLGISLKAAITQAANTPSAAQKPAAPVASTPAEATPQPAPKPKSKALVTWEWPADCSVTVNRCYVANGRLYIDLRFTNNAGEDFKYYMAASYIKVYDSDGGCSGPRS